MEMNKLNLKTLSALFLMGILLFSCSEDDSMDIMDATADKKSIEDTNFKVDRIKEIFYANPSPIEMASIIKKAGSSYNRDILNDIRNTEKYTSSKSRAINLGIYGADLSYTSIFNQNQESIIYLSCAKRLADDLGVTAAFNDEIMERFEANVENRDSLMSIISESYWVLDAYLKENNRDNISALVIAGGWLEGLYLGTQIIEQNGKSQMLVDRVVDQKYALMDLISLLESYPADETISAILEDLYKLEDIYSRATGAGGASVVSEGETAVISGGGKLSMSDADLDMVVQSAKEIRTKYIN